MWPHLQTSSDLKKNSGYLWRVRTSEELEEVLRLRASLYRRFVTRMNSVPVGFSAAVTKDWPEATGEGKGSFGSQVRYWEKPTQEPQGTIWSRDPQRNFLVCSASFLIEPSLSYPEMVLPTMHWALFHQWRKATQTCLQDNLMEESPSWGSSSKGY